VASSSFFPALPASLDLTSFRASPTWLLENQCTHTEIFISGQKETMEITQVVNNSAGRQFEQPRIQVSRSGGIAVDGVNFLRGKFCRHQCMLCVFTFHAFMI
jgi:hypothetical protein